MTLYYLLASNTLRAAATGTKTPDIVAQLRSSFEFDVAFVSLAGVVAPLEAPEGGSVEIKAVIKQTPEDAAILLDGALESNGNEGTARRYKAEWTAEACDSDVFRAAVRGKPFINAVLEIEVTHAGGTARATCPITLVNAYLQPTDAAPNPGDDASWAWLKQRLPEALGFVHDDEAKTIALAANVCFCTVSGDGLYLEFKTADGTLIGKSLLNA